jgi:riboflavin synthase
MFTGIIQALGHIKAAHAQQGDYRFTIALAELTEETIVPGDSIAVSGVCLTAISIENACFTADVSRETLSRTTLGQLAPGSVVNLELALTPQSRMGGHFVSGHVDGVGEVVRRTSDARSERFLIRVPRAIARYIAEKGSICIEGVSLTVNQIDGCEFDVNIIPHTLAVTTIGALQSGHRVNLEVDLLARYMERLLSTDHDEPAVDQQLLKDNGFIR